MEPSASKTERKISDQFNLLTYRKTFPRSCELQLPITPVRNLDAPRADNQEVLSFSQLKFAKRRRPLRNKKKEIKTARTCQKSDSGQPVKHFFIVRSQVEL